MATTYKGESIGKKITRLLFWADVARYLPRFRTVPKMVLASAEAGDVSTLLGLEADAGSIIGVDSDAEAIDRARQKFPSVKNARGGTV
jgi:hypothetical protein